MTGDRLLCHGFEVVTDLAELRGAGAGTYRRPAHLTDRELSARIDVSERWYCLQLYRKLLVEGSARHRSYRCGGRASPSSAAEPRYGRGAGTQDLRRAGLETRVAAKDCIDLAALHARLGDRADRYISQYVNGVATQIRKAPPERFAGELADRLARGREIHQRPPAPQVQPEPGGLGR
ncbi:hypothetical protein [Streptomyces niger]|uniref:hypothetical protein n=1 Tax=Streptomyces niger TaxID=66373 RepID=UPI0006998D23|nr:hypothetical protein [Streptomyces niger]